MKGDAREHKQYEYRKYMTVKHMC